MAINTRGVTAITDLLETVTDSPDFSFLNDWTPTQGSSFFPRVNYTGDEKLSLDGEDRKKLRVAIEAVQSVNELLNDAGKELSSTKGDFSNAISVFQRDGEISIVAIPVNKITQRAIGGFLLAHDLWGVPNAEAFVQDLKNLEDLIPPTEQYLRWRWWPVAKDERQVNLRSAAQLLLSATNPGDRNLHVIAGLMDSRASLSAGRRLPELADWLQAVTKLESLKDFPVGSVVVTLDVEKMQAVQAAIAVIQKSFERQAQLNEELRDELDRLTTRRLRDHLNSLSLEQFAKQTKGQGFPRKLLENRFNDFAKTHMEAGDQKPTVGAVLRLADKAEKLFDGQSLGFGIQLMRTYARDQKLLRGYPRLTDKDSYFEEFLRKSYKLQRDQLRPHPSKNQFEALAKLLQDDPEQLHLVARNEAAVKHLIGSLDTYTDMNRLQRLSEEYAEPTVDEARLYFRENPATFQTMLSALGFNALTLEQISGFLAPELTAAIRNIELETEGMKSQLRSYQTFAVQYALHQRRVVIGDEMGLGKTVTALGLAKHLQNTDHNRFLVIVPLAVLENWRREVLKHTDFEPHMLYGEDLEANLQSWVTDGGLALATFESIQKVNSHHLVSSITGLDLTVVDEAHYLKNPETLRTRGVIPWVKAGERALLMTGTPLENKLEEFEQLLSYVQPHLKMPKNKTIYTAFRKAIAPAYLRRNQVDVLQELPDLLETEEYIELSDADAEYYKRALQAGDWNLARRAKVLAGSKSSTVQRIKELVGEAMANDNKVLIFSFYREAISVLQNELKEDDPFIPLTGDLSSAERQEQVDAFTKAEKPGVLLAQIKAGGTGLNIQAASLVLILEPQTKPSLEAQAIRRAYRMGQTKPVTVVRLRARNTIDERWVAMQNEKQKLFDATAGVSDLHAFDDAVAGEQGSLFEAERRAWGV